MYLYCKVLFKCHALHPCVPNANSTWGLESWGFRVFWFRLLGLELWVYGLGLRVWSLQALGFRVQGLRALDNRRSSRVGWGFGLFGDKRDP